MRKSAVWFVVILYMVMLAPLSVDGSEDGKWNASTGCNCHGSSSSVTPVLNGFPSAYVADTTYSLSVSVGGNPATGGFNLAVSKGTLSNPDANAQVAGNGLQATHGYSPGTSSWTFDWTAPSTGSGTVNLNLAVLAGDNSGSKNSADKYNTYSTSISEEVSTNNAPTATNLVLSPGTPTTLDDLTATYTYGDDDGDAESGTTFAWHLNGVQDTAHTTAVLPASATVRGQAWHVVVTPSDGIDAGSPVSSSAVTIANSAPQVTDLTVSDEAPDTSEDVTFTHLSDDPDGDAITSTEVRWRLDSTPFSSLDNATTLPALATRAGDVWDVQVRVSDGTDMSAWFTSAVIVIGSNNQAPTVSDVVVTPEHPTSVDDLAVTWVEADPDGDEIDDRQVIWMRNGMHEPAADDLNPLPSTFTARGDAWTAFVRVSDGETWSLMTSSTQHNVSNAAPISLTATLDSPSLSALDDLSINVTSEDPDGDEVTVSGVVWHLDGEPQTLGVNQPSLEGSALARGDVWHAVVTLTDGEDETDVTTEAVTVQNAPPVITVTWPEDANALSDLSPALQVEDVDGDAVTSTVAWYKNGFRDAGLSNLTSVPAEKLAPGQTWTVSVDATDGEATSENVQSTFVIPNLAPTAVIEVVSSNLWINEEIVLSAASSTDADGSIASYRWTWDGQSQTGAVANLLLSDSTSVTLTVTDTNGETDEETLTVSVSTGPTVFNMQTLQDGSGEVRLLWSWDGDDVSFNVLRNGVVVATTTEMAYTDAPPMSGANTYTVQPFNDERTFNSGAHEMEVNVLLSVQDDPAPSGGLGLVLGGLLLIAMITLQVLGARGGGRR